ncbi:helix-turn-helix transcriptional regulator [Streptomyces sp. DSM 44917]|uniref:Helix-turn-helix transcriptional regulator n=1 Tax=Streptomyces boetiae TaxID=3075541 RepID=A0ABU2L5W8_9ACTN|nr:helix-turn-helix transcriptional regulator [Streptomyces sp. DSM 44917]MDT0306948.1 helix-turn-helix transcriptional regulator [Streptomyces sp. DSM 44917]
MELTPQDGRSAPHAMLARRLERLRKRENLSLRDLAAEIRFPHPYIHRVESGKQLPSEDLAAALDKRFDADGLFAELLDVARESVIRDYSRAVIGKERNAVRIQVFTSSVIPGLLQTPAYALELFQAGVPTENEDQLKTRVDARMKRKSIFEGDEPPYFWAIVDEAALRRAVGGPTCMSEQLRAVLEAVENPYITLQILPFGQGAHAMLGGGLTLLSPREGGTVGLVESFRTGEVVESPRRVAELAQLFQVACDKALPVQQSREIIRSYLREYEDEQDS